MAFPNNCNPRVIAVEDSAGCTLTRASILAMTPTVFENQGFYEMGMDKIIANAQQAKAAGYIERPLEALLMGRISNIKGQVTKTRVPPSGSVIQPFIYRRQKRNINTNYWRVVSGQATAGAGSGGIPASAWDLTVQVTQSAYATPIPAPERYFLPGKYLIVEWMDAGNVSRSTQFKIISAVNADSGGVYKANVTVAPNVSAATWASYDSGQKAVYQPNSGLAYLLSNSVSDYESWCHNEPTENTNKLLTYWLQTSRFTHKYNEEYLKALNAALTTNYFKDFRTLPLAEQKRQQYAKYQRDWVNSCFYGQRISDLQQVDTYTNLDAVVDPADPGCTLEYKANALGFKTQLADCSRVYDHQGNPLSLDLLLATVYDLKRAREADGGASVDTVDLMTDRFTAGAIQDIMISYYKAKFGVVTNRNYTGDQELRFDNWVALTYNVYQLPPELGGLKLAVFCDGFFDDKLAAADSGAVRNRVRTLWGLDWTDIEVGIAGTNSAQRKTNEADSLYNCVITPNVTHYQLESTTWTAIIEDPNRHYIVEGFSDSCPVLTVAGCSV